MSALLSKTKKLWGLGWKKSRPSRYDICSEGAPPPSITVIMTVKNVGYWICNVSLERIYLKIEMCACVLGIFVALILNGYFPNSTGDGLALQVALQVTLQVAIQVALQVALQVTVQVALQVALQVAYLFTYSQPSISRACLSHVESVLLRYEPSTAARPT